MIVIEHAQRKIQKSAGCVSFSVITVNINDQVEKGMGTKETLFREI